MYTGKRLLRLKPYTVNLNSSRFESLRVVLNPMCGFKPGEKVYQVKRDDGVLELIPEKNLNPADFSEIKNKSLA